MVRISRKITFILATLLLSAMGLADPDIIVVGAGPVGLATAVQIALYTKGKPKILLLEAHERYERTHPLTLNEEAFVKGSTSTRYSKIWKAWKSPVPITRVEQDLLRLAEELQIEIVRPFRVDSPKQLRQLYPKTKIIIGADGSRSAIRKYFIDEARTNRTDMQHTVRVTYTTTEATRSLKILTEAPKMLATVEHVVTESVRKLSDEEHQVTLDIIVSKEEYDAIHPYATFAKPTLWEDEEHRERIPTLLQRTIQKWMKGRAKLTNEVINQGTVKVTSTELVTYVSPQAVFIEDGVEHFLVGDAAFGVPWWRSGNNGFMCANILSKVIARKFSKLHRKKLALPPVTTPLGALNFVVQGVILARDNNDYQKFVSALQTREVLLAHLKRMGIFALETPVHVVQRLSRGTTSPRVNPLIAWEDAIAAEMVEEVNAEAVAGESEPAGELRVQFDPDLDRLPLEDTDDAEDSGDKHDNNEGAVKAAVSSSAHSNFN